MSSVESLVMCIAFGVINVAVLRLMNFIKSYTDRPTHVHTRAHTLVDANFTFCHQKVNVCISCIHKIIIIIVIWRPPASRSAFHSNSRTHAVCHVCSVDTACQRQMTGNTHECISQWENGSTCPRLAPLVSRVHAHRCYYTLKRYSIAAA